VHKSLKVKQYLVKAKLYSPWLWGWGAAVPAAVCRWGLCRRCPGVRWCLGGVLVIVTLNSALQLLSTRYR